MFINLFVLVSYYLSLCHRIKGQNFNLTFISIKTAQLYSHNEFTQGFSYVNYCIVFCIVKVYIFVKIGVDRKRLIPWNYLHKSTSVYTLEFHYLPFYPLILFSHCFFSKIHHFISKLPNKSNGIMSNQTLSSLKQCKYTKIMHNFSIHFINNYAPIE